MQTKIKRRRESDYYAEKYIILLKCTHVFNVAGGILIFIAR